jgi:hypothetical protein
MADAAPAHLAHPKQHQAMWQDSKQHKTRELNLPGEATNVQPRAEKDDAREHLMLFTLHRWPDTQLHYYYHVNCVRLRAAIAVAVTIGAPGAA